MCSCGYGFAGGGGPPKGLNTIFVRLIENQTAEIGAEIVLTDQLKNEFTRKYKGKIVPEEQADGVLSGRITDVRSWTIARRNAQASLEKRVSVTIDLTLKNKSGEVVWFTRGMRGSEDYAVSQERQGPYGEQQTTSHRIGLPAVGGGGVLQDDGRLLK
jgi:hypothetical protein